MRFGECGYDRAEEPFDETVRPRATRRNPDHADTHICQDRIERCCELAGPVADEEPELGDAIVEVHHEVADLLGGPSAVWVGGRAEQVHGSVGDLEDEEHVDALECDCAVHVEEASSTPGCAGTVARSCRCPGPGPAVSPTAGERGGSSRLPRGDGA